MGDQSFRRILPLQNPGLKRLTQEAGKGKFMRIPDKTFIEGDKS